MAAFPPTLAAEATLIRYHVDGDLNDGGTISGNTSTAWHGGALFATDGTVAITNSTIVGNNAPDGTAGGLMVATFGAPADLTVTNSILQGFGGAFACAIEGGGAGAAGLPSDRLQEPADAGRDVGRPCRGRRCSSR